MRCRHGNQDTLLPNVDLSEAVDDRNGSEMMLPFDVTGDAREGLEGQGSVGAVGEVGDGAVGERVAGAAGKEHDGAGFGAFDEGQLGGGVEGGVGETDVDVLFILSALFAGE